jgi:hypothetical protein
MDRDLLWEYWKEILGAILKQYGVLIVAAAVILGGGYYALRYALGPHIGGSGSTNSEIVVAVPADYSGLVQIILDAKGAAVPPTGPAELHAVKGIVAVSSFERFVVTGKNASAGGATAAPVAFQDEGGKSIPKGAFGDLPRAVWQMGRIDPAGREIFFGGSSKAYQAQEWRKK